MSGRAAGRHSARTGEGTGGEDFLKSKTVDPDSPEGHKLGMSKRVQGYPSPIPGGRDHILNPQTFRQQPEAPAPADFTDLPDQNAHGVPPETHSGTTRGQMMRGKLAERRGPDQYYQDAPTPVRPIPVWVVENQDRAAVFRSSTSRHLTVPANNASDPIPLCGRDPDRAQLLLLNEDPANAIRFSESPAELLGGAGALLPAGMGSYLRLITQETLYAISATGTAATLSMIQIFDQQGSGL